MVIIERRQLSVYQILSYFSRNKLLFKPPLTTRLDIETYAARLNKYAVHFCAVEKKNLVGFLGCYFNNPDKEYGFISTFSVAKEFQGKGIAKKLLDSAIEYGIKNRFRQTRLQVYVSNLKAIRLYSEYGFIEITRKTDLSEMSLNLPGLSKEIQ
jgi:ribosomal protein S18 acetylase RimI-like enzyme